MKSLNQTGIATSSPNGSGDRLTNKAFAALPRLRRRNSSTINSGIILGDRRAVKFSLWTVCLFSFLTMFGKKSSARASVVFNHHWSNLKGGVELATIARSVASRFSTGAENQEIAVFHRYPARWISFSISGPELHAVSQEHNVLNIENQSGWLSFKFSVKCFYRPWHH